MRLVGVQLMHVDDLRADFAFGERFLTMNLFALEDRMKWYAQHHKVSVEMVKANNLVCPRVIMKRNGPPKPARIQDMAVVFDPDTWLPLRVEYLNMADKKGFATIDYKSIKTNQGLKEADLKF